MSLSPDQQRRYVRQTMLSEIGEAGQQKLLNAKVLIIGAGGLGSALIPYLAAAGVGTIGIIDDDRVELSNLARQIIHETGDIGRLKVESAEDRISELNPDVKVITYPEAISEQNAEAIIAKYDVVADGCDNFKTRFTVNAACVKLRKPLVSAAIAGWNGQLMSIKHSACYACFLHPDAPEVNTCKESGVVGPLAGMIGSAQALEVVRMILGKPALVGKVALFDGIKHEQRTVTIQKDPACPVCA
jgi:molybdopterin/thiamine biosynthesis adenylyltransferase